eukprot:s1739_g4.t1
MGVAVLDTLFSPSHSKRSEALVLKRLSPEEDHISYVLATWRDISIGENVEEMGGAHEVRFKLLKLFQQINKSWFKSASAELHLAPQEWKRCWLSGGVTWKNVSEDIESAFWQAARVQRVFQVGSIKRILVARMTDDQQKAVTAKLLKAHYDRNLEAVTAKLLKAHYDRNLEVKSGEAVTEHFLQITFLIDECFGKRSPLDSVLKMENLMRTCRSVSNALEHVLFQMADWCLNRLVNPSEMQHMFLFGKGMVSVWLWKLQNKPKLLALLDQHLPTEDAAKLRKALENHQTFREHFGGMEPRSQKAADFASKFLYEMTFDFAIKQAVRHQQSLEEVLEHSGIEKAWAEIIGPQAPKLSAGDVEGETEVSKSSLLMQVLPHEHLERLSQPEHAAKLEVVENGIELARKQVRSQIQTLDGSMSLDKLAKSFRTMECSKLRGTNDSSVVFLYIVEAAGEHERDARRSPTPMRREHMEKILKAWMLTRSPDMPDLESEKLIFPQLHPSDVFTLPQLETMVVVAGDSGRMSEVVGLDQPGMEPIDWAVWDPQLFAEVVVHRFKPKLLILATASCASVLPPLLEARYSAKHEEWYQQQANQQMFRLMGSPKSAHYSPDVAKALKDAAGKDGKDDKKDGEGRKGRRGGGAGQTKSRRKSKSSKKGKGKGKGKGRGKKRQRDDDEDDGELGEADDDGMEEGDDGEDTSFLLDVTSCFQPQDEDFAEANESDDALDGDEEEEDSI